MSVEIKRPGSDLWESESQLGGKVSFADCVGSLVRYPSGVVLRVAALSEPDETGARHLQLEVADPVKGA